MLTGAVLSKLPHPNGFGLGFRSTLQGAHAEKSDSGTLVICINQHFTQTPLFSTKHEQGEHLSFAPGRAGCGAFGLQPDVKYSLMSEGFPKSELIGDLGIVQNLVDDLFTFLGLQSLQKTPCLFT